MLKDDERKRWMGWKMRKWKIRWMKIGNIWKIRWMKIGAYGKEDVRIAKFHVFHDLTCSR
jgi:hypothetical protein